MANPKHLVKLKEGVWAWNEWVKENPDEWPDLRGVVLRGLLGGAKSDDPPLDVFKTDLSEADLRDIEFSRLRVGLTTLRGANLGASNLRGVFLFNTDLREANLEKADLAGALLDRADLTGSTLRRASLVGASIEDAVLTKTDLTNSNLRNVTARRADFTGADLRGAHLTEADLTSARFPQSDLTGAIVESANVLDVEAERLQGIPRVPQPLCLEYTELTGNEANNLFRLVFRKSPPEDATKRQSKFYSCFISYSHRDQPLALKLEDALKARGIPCWRDEHDLKPGDRILDAVDHAIRVNDRVLLCCSEASLNSWWVKDEIRKALERERRDGRDILIPLDLDGYLLEQWTDGMASAIRSRLAANFADWETDNANFETAFERLVGALRTDADRREAD